MSDVNKKLGRYLKSRREAKGRSIDEMAESLKITPINITNIENGNIESIGLSEIFVRSYIKSYITEIGEIPEDIFNKFSEFQNDEATSIKKVIASSTVLYNPVILVTAVIIFSALSYFFISHVVKRDKSLMDINPVNIELEKIGDDKSEIDNKKFSDSENLNDEYIVPSNSPK